MFLLRILTAEDVRISCKAEFCEVDMKLKNRVFTPLLLVVLIFSLAGCAKCISIEYENVEVSIVDKYHSAMWMQPIHTGKVTTFITHPAIWEITVEYDGVEYTVSGSDTYKNYKDKIGQTTTGELEIKTYDDGTVKYDIVSLE